MKAPISHSHWKWVFEILVLALIYYVTARLGLILAFENTNASPIWAPSGIALAIILLKGYHMWPGIVLGAFAANFTTLLSTCPADIVTLAAVALIIGVGNTLEALVGRFFLECIIGRRNIRCSFKQAHDYFRFVAVTLLICLVSSIIGPTTLVVTGIIPRAFYETAWFTWWLGDVTGILVLVPLLVGWSGQWKTRWNFLRLMEIFILLTLIFMSCKISFGNWFPIHDKGYPLAFIPIPFLIWIAFRFGFREAAFAIFFTAVVSVWETVQGTGTFARETVNDSLLLLQIFLGVISVTIMGVAMMVTERREAEIALRTAYGELETKIQERTFELAQMNESLRLENEERKKNEEELRQSEERFRLLVSGVRDYSILMLNPEGFIVNWNVGAERINGYQAEEMIGQHFSKFYPAEDMEQNKPVYALKVASEQGRFEDEGWHVRKDGSRFWANVVITALRDKKGRLRGFSKITRDISERKKMDEKLAQQTHELLRSNTDLEQFAYIASHDLREPLRSMSAFTQLLAKRYKGKLDKEADEFIHFIVDGAARMERLINDILVYSQVGKKNVSETIDCEKILSEVLHDLKGLIEKNHAVVTHDPLPTLETDALEWQQLFQNLLSNAIKFHGSEPPRIHISVEQKQNTTVPSNGEWIFSVKDNGIGFDPKYANRIFSIFQRLHAQAEYPGTGIGLAICKKIVERHGGRIWANSQPGKGSTFQFTIRKQY